MRKSCFFFLLMLGFMVPFLAHAQPPPPPPNPMNVPIDGGLSLLLAAGAGLGGYKAWKKSKSA